MEIVLPGLKETDRTPALPVLLLLLPRQPAKDTAKATLKVRRKPEQQRCMNPPRVRFAGASIILIDWKTASVEGKVPCFKVPRLQSFKNRRCKERFTRILRPRKLKSKEL